VRILALALLALAVHVGLGLAVHTHPAAFGVDRTALDITADLRQHTVLDAVRVFTDLGSLPFAALAAAIGAFYAVRTGRTGQAIALVAGMILLIVLVNVSKQIWDRPRPADRVYDPNGSSYPSGHSAYVVAWLATATVTGRRRLIWAAVALVAAIMASRLYLHVHYLTDVLGGAALGAAVFAPVLAKR
jgi:membrane-associated phospholipid phosphatase